MVIVYPTDKVSVPRAIVRGYFPERGKLEALIARLEHRNKPQSQYDKIPLVELCLRLSEYVGCNQGPTRDQYSIVPLPDHYIAINDSLTRDLVRKDFWDTKMVESLFPIDYVAKHLRAGEFISIVVSPKSYNWDILPRYISLWMDLLQIEVKDQDYEARDGEFLKHSNRVLQDIQQIYWLGGHPPEMWRQLGT